MNIQRFIPSPAAWRSIGDSLRTGAIVGAVVGVIGVPLLMGSGPLAHWRQAIAAAPDTSTTVAARSAPQVAMALPRFADFGNDVGSPDARHVANWVADSRDNGQYDFVIVDKKFARVYVFDGEARLKASTPILLGAAPGDDSVPGIGSRPIADIRVEERTTPAGRFIGERGRNATNEDVIWVDYEHAVSMHRVRPLVASEKRLERLETPAVDDNRISWGCINVPVAFYEQYISPVFAQRKAVVYVLPEVKSVEQVFGSYDVAARLSTMADGGVVLR